MGRNGRIATRLGQFARVGLSNIAMACWILCAIIRFTTGPKLWFLGKEHTNELRQSR